MSVTPPIVSICIPTYLGAEHLAAAIDSVLSQSYKDLELVIIEDKSPDETAAVVAQYKDPRIRFLQNSHNLGPQDNWNRCLAEAQGKYFKLLPQDDVLAHDCLAKQVAVLEQDAEQLIALVFCARKIINGNDHVLARRGYSRGRGGMIPAQTLIRSCLRHGTNLIGEPGGVLFRRELSRVVGLFDASCPYVLDLDYWFRLLLKGNAYYLPETLASFRVSTGSWSVAIGSQQSGDFRRFIAKIVRNPDFGARRADVLMGNIMAKLNNYLRMGFYRLVLK